MSRLAQASIALALPALLGGAFVVAACSANDADITKAPRDKGQDGAGPGGTGPGVPQAPGSPDLDFGGDDGNGLDDDSACAAVKHSGELVGLDVYVMLDKSGSMSGTRWSSVTTALNTFVDSDEARGMGMGIQYYPLPPKAPVPPPPASCQTDSDCAPYHGDCIPIFFQCDGAIAPDSDSCNPADYSKPDVQIGVLPVWSDKIKTSINKAKPSGGTPTYPALEGAYHYAKERAKQFPENMVVVVLATDGEPNGCGSQNKTPGIAALAENALKTSPSISTFVIDVGDDAKGDLGQIAKAGGTEKAIDVSDANATTEFLEALNKIRGSVACEYRIPTPKDGDPDFDRVNVTITAEGKTSEIGRVATAAECDPSKGGWYYDSPGDPSKILLCHASCQVVKTGSQMAPVDVDVLLGCKSKIW